MGHLVSLAEAAKNAYPVWGDSTIPSLYVLANIETGVPFSISCSDLKGKFIEVLAKKDFGSDLIYKCYVVSPEFIQNKLEESVLSSLSTGKGNFERFRQFAMIAQQLKPNDKKCHALLKKAFSKLDQESLFSIAQKAFNYQPPSATTNIASTTSEEAIKFLLKAVFFDSAQPMKLPPSSKPQETLREIRKENPSENPEIGVLGVAENALYNVAYGFFKAVDSLSRFLSNNKRGF